MLPFEVVPIESIRSCTSRHLRGSALVYTENKRRFRGVRLKNWLKIKKIRLSCFTVLSEGVNSVGKVSFKSTFSIKDRGHPSILVTSLSKEEPTVFEK